MGLKNYEVDIVGILTTSSEASFWGGEPMVSQEVMDAELVQDTEFFTDGKGHSLPMDQESMVGLGQELVENGEVIDALPTMNGVALNLYNCTTEISTEQAVGRASVKVIKTTAGELASSRFVDANALGLNLTGTFDVSVDVFLPSGQTVNTLTLWYRDGEGGFGHEQDRTMVTDRWVTLKGLTTEPFIGSSVDRIAMIRAYNDTVSGEYWYIDNISVREVNPVMNVNNQYFWRDCEGKKHEILVYKEVLAGEDLFKALKYCCKAEAVTVDGEVVTVDGETVWVGI